MEVQAMVILGGLRHVRGSEYNGTHLGLHSCFSRDGLYPLNFIAPYFMLIRRGSRGPQENITLRFKLIDCDGQNVKGWKDVVAQGIFEEGYRFKVIAGSIQLIFPGSGDYRLDIVADENKEASLYHYDIEVTDGPRTGA